MVVRCCPGKRARPCVGAGPYNTTAMSYFVRKRGCSLATLICCSALAAGCGGGSTNAHNSGSRLSSAARSTTPLSELPLPQPGPPTGVRVSRGTYSFLRPPGFADEERGEEQSPDSLLTPGTPGDAIYIYGFPDSEVPPRTSEAARYKSVEQDDQAGPPDQTHRIHIGGGYGFWGTEAQSPYTLASGPSRSHITIVLSTEHQEVMLVCEWSTREANVKQACSSVLGSLRIAE